MSEKKDKNAVCCECQRLVSQGLRNGVMRPHPAIGVFGDFAVWWAWYHRGMHWACRGTGMTPQATVKERIMEPKRIPLAARTLRIGDQVQLTTCTGTYSTYSKEEGWRSFASPLTITNVREEQLCASGIMFCVQNTIGQTIWLDSGWLKPVQE